MKRIVITGCSSGFGKLMAEAFAREGWQVLATTRVPEQLAPQKNLQALAADVTKGEGRAAVVSYVRDNWGGKLDCLVNNVGFGVNGAFETLLEEQVRRQFEVNVFSAMFLTKDLLPALRAAKGRIINLSSVLGFTGMPFAGIYASSKFALEGWSESLHYELQPQEVQVALVEPGGFRTGFAKNVEWGAANDSPYAQPVQNFRNFFSRRMERNAGGNPEAVVRAVVKLAGGRRMPLRTRVGGDSQGLYFLRRFVPQRVADMVLRGVSRRLMGDG
ncbi:MAG: SDR family oxidoreductase [Alphaproteobacteria bacterium]|nr:MAG: SDR family oxidoreductase [Alphaproteobacteria bacterium]